MNNHKHTQEDSQISQEKLAGFESLKRQAKFSSYAFIDGDLIYLPAPAMIDPISDPLFPDSEEDYTLLIREVRSFRKGLESIKRIKTRKQRYQIRQCAVIQKEFTILDGAA